MVHLRSKTRLSSMQNNDVKFFVDKCDVNLCWSNVIHFITVLFVNYLGHSNQWLEKKFPSTITETARSVIVNFCKNAIRFTSVLYTSSFPQVYHSYWKRNGVMKSNFVLKKIFWNYIGRYVLFHWFSIKLFAEYVF
jgi:hypothetical protein